MTRAHVLASVALDIHYYNLARMTSGGDWIDTTGGGRCEDTAYRVRDLAGDNRWVEEVP